MSRILRFFIIGWRRWLVLLLPCGAALANIPVIDSHAVGYVDLGRIAEFSIQPRSATFADVEGFAFRVSTPNAVVDVRGEALWQRFRLVNSSMDESFRWVIHHQSSQLDELTLWTRDEGDSWRQRQAGDREPFHQRQILYRKPALGHTTAPYGYTDVVVRMALLTEGQLSASSHLWGWEQFNERVQQEQLFSGIYYGVMVTLMFFALLFAVALRDSSLYHYALFLFGTALLWAVHSGFAHQYLWPSQVWLHNESYHLAFLVFAITALQLAKSFLRTREFLPVLHWAFHAAQLLAGLGIVSRLAGFHWPSTGLYAIFNMVVLSLLPLAAWLAHYRGVERVLWFAIGWVIYALGLALASVIGLPEKFNGIIAHNYFQTVSLVQALALSFAMAERLLHLDRDRLHAIELAHQDPLTGLGNRRLLVQTYDIMRQRFKRDGLPVYLILFDIDHFKTINDRHGHDAGDLVIGEMARLLHRFSRAGDVCVRLGGEEFALLLRADNDAVPWQIAERIRTQFASTPTLYDEGEVIEHTLSAGITRVMSNDGEPGFRALLASADDALYQAKASGRNCTLFARSG